MKYLYLFKIIIHNKLFIGATYNYPQFVCKFKATDYFAKIYKYKKLYQYIIDNNIEKNEIELVLFYRKEISKVDNVFKIKTLSDFIEIYNSIDNGFNIIKPTIDINSYEIKFNKKPNIKTIAERKAYNREKANLFYLKNRDKILIKNRLKRLCECGSSIVVNQYKRHQTTRKHKYLMLTNNTIINTT